jgi:hypothetical protein
MKKWFHKIMAVSAKTWLYLFLATAIICVLALRHNNQTMANLRDDVYAADKSSGDVNTALNKLRAYVYAHMNTSLSSGGNNIKPPIQLKYTYQRLYDAQANQVQSANQQIYTDAELYCQSINKAYFGTTRVPCVQNYVINHGIKAASINIPAGLYCQSINKAYFGTTRVPCVQNYVINHGIKAASINIPAGLYEFDFVSPAWSPDLAGFSLAASFIFLAAFLLRGGTDKLRHKKSPR